jgi:hypothetical protein
MRNEEVVLSQHCSTMSVNIFGQVTRLSSLFSTPLSNSYPVLTTC